MEVEVKFRAGGDIEERVKGIAEFVCERVERDLYFTSPFRDFRKTDEALRVRVDDEGVKLTYKGPRVDRETKTREEIEVRVGGYEEIVEILERLGFKPYMEVVKRRRMYRIGDVLICVDDVEGLGRFVEIEKKSEKLEDAKKEVMEIAKKLGLNPEDSIRETYLEMLERARGEGR